MNSIKSETVRAIVFRILRNCDQLKVVADDLRELDKSGRFIGLTRRDLVNLNDVPGLAPPHHLTRIRKVWDLGTDEIVFQTVVQLDGDIIFRASRKQLTPTESPLVQAPAIPWLRLMIALLSVLFAWTPKILRWLMGKRWEKHLRKFMEDSWRHDKQAKKKREGKNYASI